MGTLQKNLLFPQEKWHCIHKIMESTKCKILGIIDAVQNCLVAEYCTVSGRVLHIYLLLLINPRCACAARITVLGLCVCLSVCLSVCLFVYDYSRTTGYGAAYE